MNAKQRHGTPRFKARAGLHAETTGRPATISELLTQALRHHQSGRLVEAEGCYRKILAMDEDHFHGLHLLGVLAQQVGRSDLAERLIGRALAANDPVSIYPNGQAPVSTARTGSRGAIARRDLAAAHSNLCIVLMALDRPTEALRAIHRSIQLKETDNSKLLFVQCLQSLNSVPAEIDVRGNLTRALSEPWGRPVDLARFAAIVIKGDGNTGVHIRRFIDSLTEKEQPVVIPAAELLELSDDSVLRSLLENTVIFDIELERYLTTIRRTMLLMAGGRVNFEERNQKLLGFFCSLSRQCFINEYAFACDHDEANLLERLQTMMADALERGESVSDLWPAAIAAYIPLASFKAAKLLTRRRWSNSVARLVAAQLQEAEQERQLRSSVPCLTAIDEQGSLAVQRQYEENPYPRWVKASPVVPSLTVSAYLKEQFSHLDLRDLPGADNPEILVAGCGTGRHSIETARRFRGARVLAIDLSRTSLCYAKRKTQELGLKNIEYAQADILQLGRISRTFDVIEASGVLHHLPDPMAGWRVLHSLLRPGGVMRLGLYSRWARQELDAAREFIVRRGYGSSAEEIRRCRQDLMSFAEDTALAKVFDWGDFFGTSTCRDLLFHVQEQQTSLLEVDDFVRQNELQFLGFILPHDVRTKFRSRFPNDATMVDLPLWHIFETENPATFVSMYQFWVRKPEIAQP